MLGGKSYLHCLVILVFLKVFLEEAFNSVVWYHTGFVVIEVGVDSTVDDEQFLVSHHGGIARFRLYSRHSFECPFTEIAAMGLLAVDEQDRSLYFTSHIQDWLVHK